MPGVAQVNSETGDQVGSQHTQGSDETYDPLWANALALLDHLTQRDLMVRNMHDAAIGQFTLLSGYLKVLNLKVMSGLWSNPAVLATFGAAEADRAIGAQLVQAFPHGIQAHLTTSDDHPSVSWMELDEAHLIVPASTLMVKYGTWIPGEWNVLGIKDAVPDAGAIADEELEALIQQGLDEAARQRHSTPLGIMAEAVAPRARGIMGRPGPFYGLTPILIFREVSGRLG